MKLLHVVGARPNFMKLAPVYLACKSIGLNQFVVHTGQHYDNKMSDIFFRELGIPKPNINLGIGSCSHATQVGRIMIAIEKHLLSYLPDKVVVYGDVNSAVAAAFATVKLGIPIVHVEAGLRSFDRTMPEEINRIVVDQLSGILFTPSKDANINLQKEGVKAKNIFFVGNVMIDTLKRLLPMAKGIELKFNSYALCTIHRPSNVDDVVKLPKLLNLLQDISRKMPIIFPVHPRTKKQLDKISKLKYNLSKIHFIEPVGYLEFLGLQKSADLVITDSGGIQEETSYLGIPCLTLRPNTERPITITKGTNKLIWNCTNEEILNDVDQIILGKWKKGGKIELWDGNAGIRIAKVLGNQS